MPRKLKPYKVDHVQVEGGRKADIFLDRNTNDFFGMVGLEEYRADTAAGAKNLTRKALMAWKPYEWKPIIMVDFSPCKWHHDQERFATGFTLTFKRLEISPVDGDGGQTVERPFLREDGLDDDDLEEWAETPEEDSDFDPELDDRNEWGEDRKEVLTKVRERNLANRERGLDISYHHERSSIEIGFTEDRWRGLLAIKEALDGAEVKLSELMKEDQPELLAKALDEMPSWWRSLLLPPGPRSELANHPDSEEKAS